jgi:hypothetical protein
MENHKGQTCIYKPVLCQEGYCDDCYIAHICREDTPEAVKNDELRAYWE